MTEKADLAIKQIEQQALEWSYDESQRYLESRIVEEEVEEMEDRIRRSFVPTALFPNTTFMTSSILVAPPQFGKSTLGKYWATALEEDWLVGKTFKVGENTGHYTEPLIVFTNSLRMGFRKVTEMYTGQNYIFLFIDDAIRHASSKRTFDPRNVQLVMDLAEIRHIVQNECGVKPPACLNLVWSTQRFKELMGFARNCHRAIYKGISVLGSDKQAVLKEIGFEAYTWLNQINRMVVDYNDFSYLSHYVLTYSAEDEAKYGVVQADMTDLKEYPFYLDDFDQGAVDEVAAYVIDYFKEDKRFPKIAYKSLGISITKDVIRQSFPDTNVNLQEVIDRIKHHYYKTGIYDEEVARDMTPFQSRQFRFRFWRAMDILLKLYEKHPATVYPLVSAAGYKSIETLRKFVRKGASDFDQFALPPLPATSGLKSTDIKILIEELTGDMEQYYTEKGYRKDGTRARPRERTE